MELFSVILMTWTSKVGRKTSTNWQFLVAKAKLLVAKATHTGAISSPDVVQALDGKCMYHLMVVWEIQLQNSLR